MRKFFMLCGLVLIAVAGCSGDKETKPEAANNTLPAKQESREGKSGLERPKTKLTLTEEKLNEVQNLKEKLTQKKEIMENKAAKFETDIAANVAEIKAERAKNGIKEFPQAISNAIIGQCLKALQKAKAYKEFSQRDAEKTWLAVIEVVGTEKQLRLDKTMLEDLDEAQITDLLRQVDFVINKVKPQAEEFKITDENTVREPLEKLYEEYIRKDEREREQRELNQKQQEEQRQKEAAEAAQKRAAEDARRAEAERQQAEQQQLIAAQQQAAEEAKRQAEERARQEAAIAEQKQAEQQRLEQERQAAATEAAERAEREAEEKRQAAAEAAERAKEAQKQREAEKEIENVKIISPLSELYVHGMGSDQWKNRIIWSHRESVVAFLMPLKIIVKELTQDSTSEIENQHDLSFIDMAWSENDKQLALLSTDHCGLNVRRETTEIGIWTLGENRLVKSAALPCDHESSIIGWRGNYVLIHNSSLYSSVFPSMSQLRPIHVFDTSTDSVSHPADAYVVTWRDSNSFFFGQGHTIKLYDLITRSVTATFDECPENGSESLFYQLCPNSLKVLKLFYGHGWLAAYTAAGDDDERISVWHVSTREKKHWFRGDAPDGWWTREGDILYIALGNSLNEILPNKQKIYELLWAKNLPDSYYQPFWSWAKPHLFLDRETEFSALDAKTASDTDRLFIKSLKTRATVAALKSDVDMEQPLIAWSPGGRYVVLCNNHFARAWDVSTVN